MKNNSGYRICNYAYMTYIYKGNVDSIDDEVKYVCRESIGVVYDN
ncbi:MAG: hypothetical protein ACI4WW_05650 [Candidatus Coprovivens sp.]